MPHVNRNGVNVYYESFGQGLPVVFLHPWTTNRYIWANQLFEFARNHRCVVVDHRGHGLSDKPASGYAIQEMAADVNAILDHAGIDRAVLVGNSIGGMCAMQVSLDFPQRVLGNLILSSATNMAASMDPAAAEAMQKDWRAVFSGLLQVTVSAKTKAERPEILAFMEGCFRNPDNFTEQTFWASVADPNGVFNWNISDRLKAITQPTRILAGNEDFATTVAHNQFLADGIPGATIRFFDDVGHFLQLEKPPVFNDELRTFLTRFA